MLEAIEARGSPTRRGALGTAHRFEQRNRNPQPGHAGGKCFDFWIKLAVFVLERLPNLFPSFVVVDVDRGRMMRWPVIGPGDLASQHVLWPL
jgi:hypothetical protein